MQKLLGIISVFSAVAVLAYVASIAMTIPDVHFSYSTDSCVKVVNYSDTQYSCENMPSKFNHVWVQ